MLWFSIFLSDVSSREWATLQLQVSPELAPFARRRSSMDGYPGGGGGGTGMTVAGFAAMREAVWPQPPRQSPTSHDAHDLNLALSMHHHQQQQHQQQLQAMQQGHAQRHGGPGGSPRVVPSPFSRAADFGETAAPQPMALPPLTLGLEPDGSGGRQHQQQGLRVDLNTTLPPQQQSPMPAEAAGHLGGGQQHHQQGGGGSQAGEGSGDPGAMLLPSAEQRQTGDWLRAAGWARGPPPEPAPNNPMLSPTGGSSSSGMRLASQQPAMSPQLTLARPSQSQSPSNSLRSPAPSPGDKPATPHDHPDASSIMSTPPQPGSAGGGSTRGGPAGHPATTGSPEFSERLRQMSLQYYKIEPASLPPDLQSSLLEVLQVLFVFTGTLP